jgi:hypothetical protein
MAFIVKGGIGRELRAIPLNITIQAFIKAA